MSTENLFLNTASEVIKLIYNYFKIFVCDKIKLGYSQMANYYSINIDKTSGNFSFTSFRGPTTLASGGTAVPTLNPNDAATVQPADFHKVWASIGSAIFNDRSVQGA